MNTRFALLHTAVEAAQSSSVVTAVFQVEGQQMIHQPPTAVFLGFFIGALSCLPFNGVFAAPGDLDTSFAGTGKTRLGFGSGDDQIGAVAVQVDGKIVVAGSSQNGAGSGFSVARYNSDGSLDASFGNAGNATAPLNTGGDFRNGVAIQSDGKIVVVGTGLDGNVRFAVLRFNSDGSLDNSFNGDGIAITPVGSGDAEARAVAIQPTDGKIVVAGSAIGADANKDFAVVRYHSDGSLDTSFGSAGQAITALGSVDEANALLIQGDGKILVVGSFLSSANNNDFAVVRYTSDGLLDTFGSSGVVITSFGVDHDVANGVAIQPGNNNVTSPDYIVVAGYASNGANKDFAIARYTFSGTLDTTFDGDGKVTTPIGPGDDIGSAVQIQGAFTQPRKIIVAGSSFNGANSDFAAVRYLSSGALDTTFNSTGLVTTPVGPGEDIGAAMVRQADGKIIVAGSAAPDAALGTNSDFAVVRYNADGSLDPAFNGTGIRTDDLGNPWAPATDVAIDADGKIVVTGSGFSGFHVMRQNGDGSLDPSFDGDGRATILIANAIVEAAAAAIQTDGKIVVAGNVDYLTAANEDFAVVRFNADGSPDAFFGSNGLVVTPVGSSVDRGRSVAIQPDGKIVVAGATLASPGQFDMALVRYDSNGSLDPSFNGTGKLITSLSTNDEATSVVIQPGGDNILEPAKIIVAGYTSGGSTLDFAVLRFNLNGSLDTSFGSGGVVFTDIESRQDVAKAVTIQGFGTQRKIVVAGSSRTASTSSTHFFSVVRYNLNGTLDNSFNGSGIVSTSFGTNQTDTRAIKLQAGKILVAGSSYNGLQADFAVVRYDSEGAIDPTYGNGGKVLVDLSNGGQDEGYGLAVDSSGRAVIAGTASGLFGVVRLLGDPLPTPTPTPTPPDPTPTPTASATPTPPPPTTTLANISTRLRVETGDNVLIGGFIVTGTQPKKIIVRGIGTSLPFADRLANPTLELRDSSGTLLESNDNWVDSPNKQAIIDSTIPPSDDLESAIVATLPANSSGYTAIVRGVDDGTGIGVVEAYDLDSSVDSKLANISTRGLVQTGDNVLIAGTIIVGQASQNVIVRAIGPSLPVPGKLEDPTLELRDGNGGLIRSNDNWRSDQEAEIIATTIPPTNDFESAIVPTLPANNASYTAIVRGVDDTTGIAVVEVYALN